MCRAFAFALFAGLLILRPGGAAAQPVPSTCIAVAENLSGTFRATAVSLDAESRQRYAQLAADEVRITYVHHSTYLIESPDGVLAATDYSGFAGPTVPDIATMNKAHPTHFTEFPDPAIGNVLKGWNPEGGPARHALTVEDMYVRNVPTDIRTFGGGVEPDGNSIFIFEVAGLCIGHLGHLHHRLTDEDYAQIGRLDILMVPVDGGYTLSQEGMGEIAKRLRSSIVLPMHRFRGPIDRFLNRLPDFVIDRRTENSFAVSLRTLPSRPTVIVLAGV